MANKFSFRFQGILLLLIGSVGAFAAVGILGGLFFESLANTFSLRGGESVLQRVIVGLIGFFIASVFLFNGFRTWKQS